jgi:hypothetical protein
MEREDYPRFFESLMAGEPLKGKLSHSLNGEKFKLTEGTILGIVKDSELVSIVSKKY